MSIVYDNMHSALHQLMIMHVEEIHGLGVRPRQPLLDLASAGAYGTHESNIERDVMRRALEGTVPCHIDPAITNSPLTPGPV